jgi:probable HAF family extracellular repeat protein
MGWTSGLKWSMIAEHQGCFPTTVLVSWKEPMKRWTRARAIPILVAIAELTFSAHNALADPLYSVTDLGAWDGIYSDAPSSIPESLRTPRTINDLGQQIYNSTVPERTSDMNKVLGHKAELWNPDGQHIPICDLGAWWGNGGSYAWAINNSGQVVGSGLPPHDNDHAFLYTGGRTLDLNALIPSSLGWTLLSAENIDDSGRILTLGAKDGVLESHALLLTPMAVPEPTPLTLLILGGTALWARHRGRDSHGAAKRA